MKTKRICSILLVIAFILAVIFSVFFAFSINKVEVNFSVALNLDTDEIQEDLDVYKGKNLFFIDTEEIEGILTENPYVELLKIEKQFPNVLSVEIKERLEVFTLILDDEVLYMSKEGIVLRSGDLDSYSVSRDKINIEFSNINVLDSSVGKVLSTDNDSLFNCLLDMANSVDLTDCIKSIKLISQLENNEAIFSVYSGVDIIINKADIDGVEKVTTAFDVYDGKIGDANGNYISDYQKFNYSISVVKMDNGEIRVTYIG